MRSTMFKLTQNQPDYSFHKIIITFVKKLYMAFEKGKFTQNVIMSLITHPHVVFIFETQKNIF